MVFLLTQEQLKNNLFLALKGKKNNGSRFIQEALKKRAGCVVTSSAITKKIKILKVKDSISF